MGPVAGSAAALPRAGCQTNAWRIDSRNFDEVLAVIGKVHQYGYLGFESGYRNYEAQFASAKEARARIEKHGLKFLGIHIFLPKYDPKTAIAPADLIDRVIGGGAALGAERLILSGAGLFRDNRVMPDDMIRKAIALNNAGRKCLARRMRLCYHNHDAEFAASGLEIEHLLKRTNPELVSMILDAGHAWIGGANVADFFARHSGRIEGIHIRDFKNKEQVIFGEGELDYRPLAREIRARGWDGWIINEEERLNDVRPGDAAVAPARRQVKKIFGV